VGRFISAAFAACLCACTIGDAPGGSSDGDDAVAGSALSDADTSGTGDGFGMLARTCAAGTTTPGIDVSYYQGTINWSRVAGAGYKFAFIRVSDGTTFHDPKFASYWTGAKTAGLVRGAYQFFRPAQSATAQADLMIAAVGTLGPGDLPPVIDVEVTQGLSAATIAARIRTWVDRVKAATGVDPIVYTGKYFWRDDVGGATTFVDNPLWIAQYTTQCPDLPAPWGSWAFWQYSESGHVAGISGGVDMDRFNGSFADLQALAGGMSSGNPPPMTNACPSETMGRDVAAGECVQSAADRKWYRCGAGNWTSIASTSSCTASYGWCPSTTLGRAVPPRTCVQAASDDVWYQCDGTSWVTPVDSDAAVGPAGVCSQSYQR
jgi:GH25 family lysozyme M1 (1,4-beta-N-acetylmuramidase)